MSNGSAAWQSVTVNTSGGGSTIGNVFVPPSTENFTYDDDGNLLSDGRWTYIWDLENRLKEVVSLAGNPAASKRKVTWEYDHQGRRIRQTTYDGSSGTYVMTSDLKLLNDGWACLAELNASNNALIRSYVWGLDLSGSAGGAGGVGGLVCERPAGGPGHFACYDGSGNVVGLVDGSNGTISAQYEYSAFGETIRATGPQAKLNPYRFSTKRTDDITDLVLYETRAYLPWIGRWLNRDSVEEHGGANLFGFVGNDPLNRQDILGKYERDFHFSAIYYIFRARCYSASEAKTDADSSQFVDEDPATDPVRLGIAIGTGSEEAARLLRDFHFYGSARTWATKRNSYLLAQTIREELSGNNLMKIWLGGRLLHTYADTWSHEGFTAWWSDINRRLGTNRPPIGHLDTGEGGHAPDRPYNDVSKASEAALAIFDLIPGKARVSRDVVRSDLERAFLYRNENETVRSKYLDAITKNRFGQ